VASSADGTAGTLADLTPLPPAEAAERTLVSGGVLRLEVPDIVSIAVQGHAIGAGPPALSATCAPTTDAKLTMAEVNLASVPDLGGTKSLVDAVATLARSRSAPPAAASALPRPTRSGSPSRRTSEDLDGAVRDLASAILAGARNAIVEIKALLRGAAGRSAPEQRLAEREAQVRRMRDLAGIGE
jgi:enoyl-CoA hydratase/carnithine racemase